MMFIYGHLTSIASSAGIKNVVDFYDKIVSEQENLAGLSEAERRQVIYDSHVDAWNYFAQIRDMAEKEGNVKPAVDLFGRLADLDRKVNPDFGPPVKEINWYNGWQRSTLLEQFRTSPSPETAEKILSIPDLDQATGRTTCLTRESADLIDLVRRNMESSINSTDFWRIGRLQFLKTTQSGVTSTALLRELCTRGLWTTHPGTM